MRIKTLAVLAVLALSTGCDTAVDCDAICSRYKSCFDSDYDVDACASRCRNNSMNDADYKHDVDVCSACIDSQSCSAATFNCAGDCGDVVP